MRNRWKLIGGLSGLAITLSGGAYSVSLIAQTNNNGDVRNIPIPEKNNTHIASESNTSPASIPQPIQYRNNKVTNSSEAQDGNNIVQGNVGKMTNSVDKRNSNNKIGTQNDNRGKVDCLDVKNGSNCINYGNQTNTFNQSK